MEIKSPFKRKKRLGIHFSDTPKCSTVLGPWSSRASMQAFSKVAQVAEHRLPWLTSKPSDPAGADMMRHRYYASTAAEERQQFCDEQFHSHFLKLVGEPSPSFIPVSVRRVQSLSPQPVATHCFDSLNRCSVTEPSLRLHCTFCP
jgi:hypothetical protein